MDIILQKHTDLYNKLLMSIVDTPEKDVFHSRIYYKEIAYP